MMSALTPQVTITISISELEALIRRVVLEAMHEELSPLLRRSGFSGVDDWDQEGPADLRGDEKLLAEALAVSQQYRDNREGWKRWEDFKAELVRMN
jgi:hypothetical protein